MRALLRPLVVSSSLLRARSGARRPRESRVGRTLVQAAATGAVVARTVRRAYGVRPRHCPVCGYAGYFHAYGVPLRFDARCPHCRSLERHRLLALWLSENGKALDGADVLHFAPEPSLVNLIRPMCGRYTTADGFRRADLHLDIERIAASDCSYDYVLCSHVLEHVDDRRALRELYRITRPGGAAILLVPIVEGWRDTFEDPGVVDPKERELLYGQHDHVRVYGRDFRDRVRDTGFLLDEFVAVEPAVSQYSLARAETVFIATRPAT